MQTSAISESAAPTATLQYSDSDGVGEHVDLTPIPFVVGRADTSNLQIDSNRVSREHAVITWEGGRFQVRDLGSTNGTYLNGNRIKQEPLTHGDRLRIADIDLVVAFGECSKADRRELVTTLRVWHEAVLRQGWNVGFAPLWDLQQSRMGGATVGDLKRPACAQSAWPMPALDDSYLSQQLQWLTMTKAVEAAQALPADWPLLLRLSHGRDAEMWLSMMARQSAGRPLVVCLPPLATADQRLTAIVRDLDMKLACWLGAGESIAEGCDQVWLPSELTEDLVQDESRWQPLADVVQTAADTGAETVAVELHDEEAVRVCGELGFAWAAGAAFGGPCSLSELTSG